MPAIQQLSDPFILIEMKRLCEADRLLLSRIYALAKRCWQKDQTLVEGSDVEAMSDWLDTSVNAAFIEELQGLGRASVLKDPDLAAYFHAIKADKLTVFIGRIGLLLVHPSSLERARACAAAARELAERINGLTIGLEG